MKILSLYQPTHYNFYVKKINRKIGKSKDIYQWIKKQSANDLKYWARISTISERDSKYYYEECFKYITIAIRLFIIELEVEENIQLNNSEIEKILKRFKHCIYSELKYKNNKLKKRNQYSLIKDTF
jgi:hypothetical protein